MLPLLDVRPDPHGGDCDGKQTKLIQQQRLAQEAPRSNTKTSFGAGNRPPSAASFAGSFYNSAPTEESKKVPDHSDWIETEIDSLTAKSNIQKRPITQI